MKTVVVFLIWFSISIGPLLEPVNLLSEFLIDESSSIIKKAVIIFGVALQFDWRDRYKDRIAGIITISNQFPVLTPNLIKAMILSSITYEIYSNFPILNLYYFYVQIIYIWILFRTNNSEWEYIILWDGLILLNGLETLLISKY